MPRKATARNSNVPSSEIYSESALWKCLNNQTGFVTNINGVLAQVLKKYPDAYQLTLLSPKGA